ncbi:MAG: DUF1223 domain-containing protein [Rhizobiaceae bacterium]
MIRQLLVSAALAAVVAVSPAEAGKARQVSGVVELFTSQGCHSCPPADRVLVDLANEGEVIALGYHVDYWDYLGWKDTLGSPEYTERQYGYSRTFAERSVYTPQAVINGRLHLNGGDRRSIDRNIQQMDASGEALPIKIDVEESGDSLIISADEGDVDALGDAHLVLVYFDKAKDVKIDRGENRGKTITYANIVTGLQTAGMWHGDAIRYELPMSEISKHGDGGCAVLLQVVSKDGSPGAIIGASLLEH